MKVGSLLLVLALPAVVAVTGCSKRENLKIVEFKDRSITVGQFEKAYAKVDSTYLPKAAGFEGKLEFLQTMLNRAVMEYKADELGYDKDPAVVQGMETFERMGLQVAFLKRSVGDKTKVSDAEVRQHYDNLGTTLNVKQILLDTPDEADAAYQALLDGGDFESVCKQYSKLEDAAEGGRISVVAYGRTTPELQTALFALPVGGFTEPIPQTYGWLIVKVLKRSASTAKAPFEETRDELREQVMGLKNNVAVNKFTEKIREDYGVEWYYENMGIVFNAMPKDRPFDEAPRREDEVYPLLYFEQADFDKPLVTYQGKTITIKDFSDFYDQASFFNRPRKAYRLGAVKQFLMDRVMNDIVMDVVEKSNIREDPEVKDTLRRKKNELMVNSLYEDMVNKQTVVTHEQIQTYYNNHLDELQVPERRRFGVILTGDQDAAREALKEIKQGVAFRDVALVYSLDEETKRNNGESGEVRKGESPEIDAVGFSLARVGDVSEPFQTSRGWMILKLLEKQDTKVFTFEESQPRIEAALKQIANEERLKELLAKWKEELGVVIHEDNLRKAQLEERTAVAAKTRDRG